MSVKSPKNKEFEITRNRVARQRIMTSFVSHELSGAMNIVNNRANRHETSHVQLVQIPFWLPNSVMMHQHYSLLEDRGSAMQEDVEFFQRAVAEHQKNHPNFVFTLLYNNQRTPVQIDVKKS